MGNMTSVESNERFSIEMDQNIAIINNFLEEWNEWLELVWDNFEFEFEDIERGIKVGRIVSRSLGAGAGLYAGSITAIAPPYLDALDSAHTIKFPMRPNSVTGQSESSYDGSHTAPSVNSLQGDGSIELELTALSDLIATLNDPLLPAFAEAIKDVTESIKEAIDQLDACMAEHACCESGDADANAGVVEAAVDKGLIPPAFGLMPETDEEGGSEWEGGLVGQGIFPDAGGEQSSSPKEAARTVFQDLIPSVEQLDARLGGLFDDIVKNGGDAFESLTGVAKSIVSDFANNVLGNLFQSMGPFGQIAQSLLGSFIPGLAGGGAFQPGSPVLVGERGPELLIPSAPGGL